MEPPWREADLKDRCDFSGRWLRERPSSSRAACAKAESSRRAWEARRGAQGRLLVKKRRKSGLKAT